MAVPGASPRFEIEANTLRVRGEIGFEEEEGFEKALMDLVEAGHTTFVIDLSGVNYITSSCVRHIAMAMVRAKQKGCQVTVRARQRVLRLLQIAGIEKLGATELVDED